LMQKGREFERAVLAHLGTRWPIARIAERPDQARSLAAAEATLDAMAAGAPVIAAAVLRDPQARTYGVADLLLRSDVLGELCPEALAGDQLELPISAFAHGRHYRVIDLKFSTLALLKDGGLGAKDLDDMAQAWIYNQALGRIQRYTPPAAYVAGRGWRQGPDRGDRCWERLARVGRDAFVRSRDQDLGDIVADGLAWIRRVRTEGAEWRVLPVPSVPELWPNMKAEGDFPWHHAKAQIAAQLGDLTILPRVNAELRAAAHARGVTRWDDGRTSAGFFAIDGAAGLRSASDVRLVHWSPAEESNFEKAYESARSRHPDRHWPPLQWYDLLNRVFRAEPVVVRGAFSFSLKQVARAMHAAGLIETEWGEGLADGAGAMAGAWAAAAESRARGRGLRESPIMSEIARYNEVDCRVMAEILEYLRRER